MENCNQQSKTGKINTSVYIMINSERLQTTFSNSKPDKLNLGDNSQYLRFGIGIRVMDYFWITGGSIYASFLGNFLL